MTCVAALGFMLVLSTLLFIFAEPLIRIFSRDAGVIELGRTVLRIVAFGEPFYGLNLVISGTLAGRAIRATPFSIVPSACGASARRCAC